MPTLTADEIRTQCVAWAEESLVQSDQREQEAQCGPSIGEPIQAPLTNLGIDLESTDHVQLCATVAGAAVCLVTRGSGAKNPGIMVGADYRNLWAWCAELLAGAGRGGWPAFDLPQNRHFALAAHAAIARSILAEGPGINRHARELGNEYLSVLPYLAFPLLESVLKSACKDHFDEYGVATRAFEVPTRGDTSRRYGVGDLCSSTRDLWLLFTRDIAPPGAHADLDAVVGQLDRLAGEGETGIDVLQGWRNDSSHGSVHLPVVGGLAFSMAILVALAGRDWDHDPSVARIRAAQLRAAQPRGVPLAFYPPE